jgi:hypothetical protein
METGALQAARGPCGRSLVDSRILDRQLNMTTLDTAQAEEGGFWNLPYLIAAVIVHESGFQR